MTKKQVSERVILDWYPLSGLMSLDTYLQNRLEIDGLKQSLLVASKPPKHARNAFVAVVAKALCFLGRAGQEKPSGIL